MTNEQIREIVSDISFDRPYKVTTSDGTTYIGIVDGPYKGYPQARFEDYRRDYLYISLLNGPLQTIRIYSENINNIDPID